MCKFIIRPDMLFSLATVQALSPYVFWQFGIGEFKGQENLTYIPLFVWTAGWIAFLAGSSIPVTRALPEPVFQISSSEKVIKVATYIMMAILCAQIASLAQLYGGLPILSYLRQDGAINIGTAVALQEESATGQVGSVYITTAVLHGLILLLIINNLEQKRRDQLLIFAAFLVLFAAHAVNGKRQGFVRCAVFLFTGLTLYAGNPVSALAGASRLVRTRRGAWAALAVTLGLLFLSFGYLANIRNQGHYKRGSMEELIAYQEYSLINYELECSATGLAPHRLDFLLWMRRMIPYKWMEAVGMGNQEMPQRYEPWAPAGLYEDIHWSLGVGGCVIFAFLLGVSTMWCYRQALASPFCLLAYCQVAFSLMLAHSFNEFISLSWIPAPLMLFFFLRGFLSTTDAPTQIEAFS